MAYATIADLAAAIGSEQLILLTDRVNIPPVAVDEALAQRALDEANALVDSYLAARYALPIPSTAETVGTLKLLRGMACDIARYQLHQVAPDEDVKIKHDDALRFLRDLQRGAAVLAGVSTGQAAGANLAEFVSGRRVFGGLR